jgi:serine/threonine-protein kinase RsbT
MSGELLVRIRTEMDASQAVLQSAEYAMAAGFQETASRMISTAVSELVRNILKYAGAGEIRLRRIEGAGGVGIEIEAVDRGPGIADREAAMRDHFSSGGTLGLGLPGVERMMDEFTLDSAPGEGTRVRAVKWI